MKPGHPEFIAYLSPQTTKGRSGIEYHVARDE